MTPMKEPRKGTKAIRRLRVKANKDERFARLLLDIRKAMITHMASANELRQAATLVAHNHRWALYMLLQSKACREIGEKLDEELEDVLDDEEEEDDGGAHI